MVITVPETASLSPSTSSPEIALLRDVIVAPTLLVIVISCALLIFIPFELREIIEPELVIVTSSACRSMIVLFLPCIFAPVSTIIVAVEIPSLS